MEEMIQQSRDKELVADDKFDKHMIKARITDLDSRRTLFMQLSSQNAQQYDKRRMLTSSMY